jgi:hypothetical protein
MLELLKRIEEQNAEEDEALLRGSDEDEDADDLAQRWCGVDICKSS